MKNKRSILFGLFFSVLALVVPTTVFLMPNLAVGDKIQGLMAYFTFLAVFVALFGEKIWEYTTRPVLAIDFELNPPGCHKTKMKMRNSAISFPVYYFRVLIKNYGKRQAEECEVMLDKIYIKKEGIYEIYENYTPTTLNWSGGRNPYLRTIQPERGVYCNLGRIHPPNHIKRSIFLNMTEENQKLNKFMLELVPDEYYYSQWDCLLPGKYKLDLVVYSKNASASRRSFEISWSGKWKDTDNEMFTELVIE